MKNEITKISFTVSAKEKRRLKIQAMNNDMTLTEYIRGLIFKTDNTKTASERINEINNILSSNGMNMSKDEREQLKAEREKLRGGVNNG